MQDIKEYEKEYQNSVPEIQEPKKHKYSWVGMIFLLLIIGLGIYLMFKITDLLPGAKAEDLATLFKEMNLGYLLLSIGIAVLIPSLIVVEYAIVSHAVSGNVRPGILMKTTLLGKYYDYITPFSTGGQPMQIHYLHKHNYDGAHASAIILIRYSVNIVCWLLVGVTLMALGFHALTQIADDGSRIFLLIAGIVGISINILLPLSVLIFVIAPRFANWLTKLIVKIGMRFHIVKDPYKALKKAYKTVFDFRMCFRTIAKKPWHFIFLILISLIEYFLTFALPFVVMKSLTNLEWSQLIDVAGLNAFSTFAVSFIPTPGNAGGLEISSSLAFNAVAPGVAVYGVLIWRLLTYYVFILTGIGLSIRDIIKKAIIASKEKRKLKRLEKNNE